MEKTSKEILPSWRGYDFSRWFAETVNSMDRLGPRSRFFLRHAVLEDLKRLGKTRWRMRTAINFVHGYIAVAGIMLSTMLPVGQYADFSVRFADVMFWTNLALSVSITLLHRLVTGTNMRKRHKKVDRAYRRLRDEAYGFATATGPYVRTDGREYTDQAVALLATRLGGGARRSINDSYIFDEDTEDAPKSLGPSRRNSQRDNPVARVEDSAEVAIDMELVTAEKKITL